MDKELLDQLHAKMHKQDMEEASGEVDKSRFRYLAPLLLSKLDDLQQEAAQDLSRRKPRQFDD
jgi:hypothetical protein